MRCTRAATVRYTVIGTPIGGDGGSILEEESVALRVEATVRRRLLTMRPESIDWPDVVAAPLFDAGTLTLVEERHTLTPERGLHAELRRLTEERDGIAEQWAKAIQHVNAAVPRRELEGVVAEHIPDADREMMRFGRQVSAALAPPRTAEELARCRAVVERLAGWVDAPQLMEAAERHFQAASHAAENAAIIREALAEEREALVRTAEAGLAEKAAEGLCVPEQRFGLLDEMLYVFDGEYEAEEMRPAMAAHLADLRERLAAGTEELDTTRGASALPDPGAIADRVRALVWRRDGGRCVVCGRTEELAFDHAIPQSEGGASTVNNVVVMCSRCSEKKGAQVGRIRESTANLRDRYDGTMSLFGTGDG